MRRSTTWAFLSLVLTASLAAATFDRVTDAALLQRADLVVVAKVESVSSRWTPERSIVTDYRFRIEEVLRGTAPGDVITVTEFGGQADSILLTIPGSASYQAGSRVLAFLRGSGNGSYHTAYMAFGALRFEGDVLVRNADGVETLSGDHDFGPLPAAAYLDYVRGNTAVPPVPLKIDSQRFEPRAEAVPSAYLAKGGSPLRAIRWKDCETGCSIDFLLNNVQDGVPDTAGGVEDALAAWTSDTNSFVNMNLAGLTPITSATTSDGANTILLSNSSAVPSGVACDTALACGWNWASTAATHTFKGETFYTAFEGDVVYRPGATGQTVFEAILAHELGHVLSFRHANDGAPSSSSALMSYPTSTSQGATLQDWDHEAMAEVYGPGLPCTAPTITSVTGGGTVNYGTKASLNVTATGTTPRTYQWYEGPSPNTANPVGSNSTSYLTPNITVEHQYWVKVTNACGFANSNTVTVTPTECTQPSITTHPADKNIQPNQTATLNVVATGTTPLTYAWYEGNSGDTTKKVGTNSAQFTTPALTANTTYWVKVSNACGSKNSNAALVRVAGQCVPPAITQHPASVAVNDGLKVTLTVAASGDAPLTFQWYEGDAPDTSTPVTGQTSATFEAGPFTTAGTKKYWAKATNTCGSANSGTATITISCTQPTTPVISAPPIAPRALGYDVSWTRKPGSTPSILQEATNPTFTANVREFTVPGPATKFTIPAHTEVTADTRFYYRVQVVSECDNSVTPFSNVADTLVTVPLPQTSNEFLLGIPAGTTQTLTQDYLVPGFGATATSTDTFSISEDAPWLSVFPASGALSAGGTTVQFTINPAELSIGTTTATVVINRVNGSAAKTGLYTTTTSSIPFSTALVTPVTPAPRDTVPPAGTLVIPAIAHADGIGTRFQSDIRLANAAAEAITYEIAFTPSASNGTQTGKKTTMVINSNETKSLDDIVKIWFGTTAGLGTLEIRPLRTSSGGVPSLLSTVASSRTYSIGTNGTLGQFIPALPLTSFIGDIAKDALAKISLQQIANNTRYRTNIGFAEGSGAPVAMQVNLLDTNNNVIKSVPWSLQPYEHQHLGFGNVFGDTQIPDGRIEVQVTSPSGKVTAYASVLDNDTTDPLLVFPVQAGKVSAAKYVVPGVAELNAASNFHTDMRVYNPGSSPVLVTLSYKPQRGDSTPIPGAVTRTIPPGITSIDNVLPTLWNLNGTGGAVTLTAPNSTPLVITARTFSREADGGTFGQFIPAVTSADAVGAGERAIEILQLEDSPSYRSNLCLVEVTGNPVDLELTLRPPDAKFTIAVPLHLDGGEFMQIGRIFHNSGFGDTYNGRVSVRVLAGAGRVAGYGSVVDNRTADPTYVPSQ